MGATGALRSAGSPTVVDKGSHHRKMRARTAPPLASSAGAPPRIVRFLFLTNRQTCDTYYAGQAGWGRGERAYGHPEPDKFGQKQGLSGDDGNIAPRPRPRFAPTEGVRKCDHNCTSVIISRARPLFRSVPPRCFPAVICRRFLRNKR